MKKIHLILALFTCLALVSCDKEEDYHWNVEGKIYDFGPLEFYIEAFDGEQDLLNPTFEGNICQEVSVTYDGETYYYTPASKLTPKHYPAKFKGLQLRPITQLKEDGVTEYIIYALILGEFDFTKKYVDEKFTINWPDGKKDKVKWSHWLYYDTAKADVGSKGNFYLNGKKLEGPFIIRKY